jgi:long-chain acyl-CoA synthetase
LLSLQHSHGYSGSFLNYITMDNRFLDLIERSIKEHWDLPAFSDYNGHTFHFKDVARRIEKFHILLEHAGIKKGDKVAIVGRNSSNWAICFFGILAYGAVAVPILHEFKPDNIQPFGSKSRTGRLQQLGEHERKDDAGCQAIHDAGQLLHYRLQK